jgi:hypothetical protein
VRNLIQDLCYPVRMPAVDGLGLGLAASIGLTRLLVSLLYGVSPTDPATLGLVGLLQAGVALLACSLPAGRATRVDDGGVALRMERWAVFLRIAADPLGGAPAGCARARQLEYTVTTT